MSHAKDGTNEKRLNKLQAERRQRHEERVARVPIENMMYKDLPPPFISVVGPAGSGKSTLMRSMVKYFTHQSIDGINGPITLSSSKTKRLTLFEVRADIHQFIDASKISDLVIFVIDASVGLEMETFEFLSLLMSHGLSKVMCAVTNVDKSGNQKQLKSIKKRIWAEICPGIKFFYLGKMHNGRYVDSDLSNLCRVLGVMKYRPIEWKCTHPHIVVDKIDGAFVYGYARGGGIKKDMDVHIPGFGDTRMMEIEVLADPVPLHGECRLSLRSKTLYSPMVGDLDEKEIPDESLKIEIVGEEEVKLFKGNKNVMTDVDISVWEAAEDISVEKEEKEEVVDHESEDSSHSMDELKNAVSGRFQKSAVTEEELVERFNEKYEEKERDKDNFLLREKKKLGQLMKKNEEIAIPGVILPGRYVRVRLSEHLPVDMDFSSIVVLGTFLISEKGMGVIQGKIKRHKWCKRILKTNEPLIFSVGWRRFQSIPVFSMKDATRNRVIKYSPESMHCNVSFYGPVVPAGTGFSVYTENANFKILGSGTVTDVSGNARLVKKLKLVGYPREIIRNTVFVMNMFTSDLEVLKFQGASLKTVSGLRGQVKGPKGHDGEYRATFEGKMLMSDIITLRCFVPIEVNRVFIPVSNLLDKWKGLRRLHEIREELGIKHTYEESSDECQEHEVDEGHYDIPPEIQRELPLDKRTVSVISNRIELPTAPDAKDEKEEMKRLRKIKDEEEEERTRRCMVKKEAEIKERAKEKEKRVRKTIREDYKKRQKKFGRK